MLVMVVPGERLTENGIRPDDSLVADLDVVVDDAVRAYGDVSRRAWPCR